LEKKGYMIGSVVAFSAFDYAGYNLSKDSKTSLDVYRVVQVLVQVGITKLLIEEVGLPEAIGFNLIWWTWGADLLYYQWGRFIPPYDRLTQNKGVTWAHWTPVGLVRGRGVIANDTLIAQATIGLSISLAL